MDQIYPLVTKTLDALVVEWIGGRIEKCDSAADINSGPCALFADDAKYRIAKALRGKLPRNSGLVRIVDDFDLVKSGDLPDDWLEHHTFLKVGERYFDAIDTQGVGSPMDLRFFISRQNLMVGHER